MAKKQLKKNTLKEIGEGALGGAATAAAVSIPFAIALKRPKLVPKPVAILAALGGLESGLKSGYGKLRSKEMLNRIKENDPTLVKYYNKAMKLYQKG